VEIAFKNKKLGKQLTDSVELQRCWGELAKKIKQRIAELSSLECLEDVTKLPALRCHELSGNRKGELAVWVSERYRIVFKPNHNPLPCKDDGGLDWKLVTKIVIIEVVDYH